MKRTKNHKKQGLLSILKSLLESNRLGDLMVRSGLLTPVQLEVALAHQKESKDALGRVLIQKKLASRRAVYGVLAQQWTLRCLAGAITILISLSSMGLTKSARASSIKDIPARVSVMDSSAPAFARASSYPALFGTDEESSTNLSPFVKWTGMFDRFETALSRADGQKVMQRWKSDLRNLRGLELKETARRVNALVNKNDYILDNNNWGRSDYWATPVEFLKRGGDCEDFAIAKYTALRALGVPEDRLRIAIVHDKIKDIPHAVLVVYTENEALILDNQNERVRSSADVSRYRPIFSINRHAWWLHTAPQPTVIASR